MTTSVLQVNTGWEDVTTKPKPTHTAQTTYRNIGGGLRPPLTKGVGGLRPPAPFVSYASIFRLCVCWLWLCFTSSPVLVHGGGAMTDAHGAVADAKVLPPA